MLRRALVVAALVVAAGCLADDDVVDGGDHAAGGSDGPRANDASAGADGVATGGADADADPGAADAGEDAEPDGPAPQAAMPTFSPASGAYPDTALQVTIVSTTPNATIHYTMDGTTPTDASPTFSTPIDFFPAPAAGLTLNFRAFATAPGFRSSSVAVAQYLIYAQYEIAPATFDPVAGEYNNPIDVGLATTSGPSIICYTVDGSGPVCTKDDTACMGASAKYTAGSPIPIDAPIGGGPKTVKAMVCSVGNGHTDVTTATYSFKVAAPTITPAFGTYVTPQDIRIQNGATNDATLCWSTDDTPVPTDCAPKFGVMCESRSAGQFTTGDPLLPNQSTAIVLRVRAYKSNYVSSTEQRNVYAFGP